MKHFLLFLFILLAISSIAQEKELFLLKGLILSHDSVPVENAYIINYRTYATFASRENGRFNVFVQPGDSMVISHLSHMRKIIYADSVRKNPEIYLELDTVSLGQVNIFQKHVDKVEHMRKNLKAMKFTIIPQPFEPYTESEKMKAFVAEHNNVKKAEATSLKFYNFSVSSILKELFKRKKNKKYSKRHKSTRKKK